MYLFININQLDALNFIIRLFQASTCFEHMCSSSGGRKLYYTVSGIITPIGGRPVHGYKTNTTQNQPHQISNTQRTENKTTDVVIQQHSSRLLKMDILMSETCWAHKNWNKIASDIKLFFHSSTITMMHGAINIRFVLTVVVAKLLGTRIAQ